MRNIFTPWATSIPIGTLLMVIGPFGYMAHNSFGSGMSVAEVRDGVESGEVEFENPVNE
jgi:hypothetical protein